MFRLGQKVYIIGDRFEQQLPIGTYGYIIALDKNPDNAFDYVLRVPKLNRQFYVTASDIELEEVLLEREASRVEKEALIDYALATKNEELFNRIMNGDVKESESSGDKSTVNQNDFIRQIHLKAWI